MKNIGPKEVIVVHKSIIKSGYSVKIRSVYETLYDATTGTIVANSISKESSSSGTLIKSTETAKSDSEKLKIRMLAAAMALNKNINGVRNELMNCMSKTGKSLLAYSPTVNGGGKYVKDGYGGWSSAWRTTYKKTIEQYENYQTLQKVNLTSPAKTKEVTINDGSHDEKYITMGPFKMTYGTAEITDVIINNQSTMKNAKTNAEEALIDYTRYILKENYDTLSYKKWNTTNTGSNSSYDINNKEFYILISKTRLNELVGNSDDITIKFVQKEFSYEKGIAFVCNDYSGAQGNVWYAHTPDKIPGGTATFSLKYTNDLIINKEVTGAKDGTNRQMSFVVITKSKADGTYKFLSKDAGVYNYERDWIVHATTFKTDATWGKKILENLSTAYEYCIVETEAPEDCVLTAQKGYKTKDDILELYGLKNLAGVCSNFSETGMTINMTNKASGTLTITKTAKHAKNSQMTFVVLTRPVDSTGTADIGFLQTNDDGETYKYNVKKQANATTFKTTKGGSYKIKHLSTSYQYCIVEIEAPVGCEITKQSNYKENINDIKGLNGVCSGNFIDAGREITMDNDPELITITVKKIWKEADGDTSSRPKNIKVKLSAKGGKRINSDGATSITKSISSTTNEYTFKNLYRYDADGELITYKIEEVDVPNGYTVSYSNQSFTTKKKKTDYTVKITNSKGKTTQTTFTLQKIDKCDKGTESLEGVKFTISTQVWQYELVNSKPIYRYGSCSLTEHGSHWTGRYTPIVTDPETGKPTGGDPIYESCTHYLCPSRRCWIHHFYYTENYYKWIQHTYYLTRSGTWVADKKTSDCYFTSDEEGKITAYRKYAGNDKKEWGYITTENDGTGNPASDVLSEGQTGNCGVSHEVVYKSTDSYVTITEEELPGDYNWMYPTKNSWQVNKDEISTAEVEAENHQEYVSISGFVWLDGSEAEDNVDNVFDEDDDSGLNGITVKLSNGIKDIKSATTQELGLYDEVNGGEYRFDKVSLDDIKSGSLYVTFEYCGITYQSVVSSTAHSNDVSKAAETSSRQDLNNKFSSVNGEGSQLLSFGGTTVSYSDINYNDESDNYESKISKHTGCEVKATTQEASYIIYDDHETANPEIRYINFGLYEKEQTDYEIENEVYGAKVTINGYSHQYDLSDVEKTLKVYSSDLDYTNSDSSKELQVYMTYKVTLKNPSSYNAKINSVAEYCDKRLEVVAAGTELDGNGNISDGKSMVVSDRINITTSSNYVKYIINTNTEVEAGGEQSFYVQVKIDRTQIDLLNSSSLKKNVVEIKSYTTHPKGYSSGSLAVLDTDSVPGNANPDKDTTFEDDTATVSPISIQESDYQRKVSGNVFVDSTGKDSSTHEKEERIGDGIYDSYNENGVANVKVTMYEVDEGGNELDGGQKYNAVDTTSDDGAYTIEGYIPGNYVIKYTWGDSTYTVQNYKGTIYNDSSRKDNAYWYKENVDEDSVTRYSDAMDVKKQRKEIDKQISAININTAGSTIEEAYTSGTTTTIITTMDSITPKMAIGVEYDNDTITKSENQEDFEIEYIDFGIVERPKMQMELSKRVSSYKLTLSNGTVLARVDIDAEGNATGSIEDVSFISGLLKQEIDLELVYGASLEITYAFKVTNISELDYSNWDYYYYGTDKSNVVKLSATEVVDYLSNQLDVNVEMNKDSSGNDIWVGTDSDYLEEVNASEKGDTTYLKTINLYKTSELSTALEPGDSTGEVSLYVSKLIGRDYDTSFNNKAEITKIDKTTDEDTPTGSIVITVDSLRGTDFKTFADDQAETVAIMPPTGGNNTEIYVIFGITMSVILIAGVIIIKIKILK